jgi:hypothetical protein
LVCRPPQNTPPREFFLPRRPSPAPRQWSLHVHPAWWPAVQRRDGIFGVEFSGGRRHNSTRKSDDRLSRPRHESSLTPASDKPVPGGPAAGARKTAKALSATRAASAKAAAGRPDAAKRGRLPKPEAGKPAALRAPAAARQANPTKAPATGRKANPPKAPATISKTATARKGATTAKKVASRKAAKAKTAKRPPAVTNRTGGVRSGRSAPTAHPGATTGRSPGRPTRTRTRSLASPVNPVDHSALRLLGVSPGERVRFRRQAAGRWSIGIVVRRERDGSIGLTGPNGAARAIPIERIEVGCTGPRGAQSWEPLTIRASRSEQLRLL